MIEFVVTLLGLGLAARFIPGLATAVNWFFVFPVCIIVFGTFPYLLVVMITNSWMSMGVYAGFLGFIGVPVGFTIAKIANS